jgi:hypothetical protein
MFRVREGLENELRLGFGLWLRLGLWLGLGLEQELWLGFA